MKFKISRDKFLQQLGIAVRGVSTRSAIQTLSGVLLRAGDGGVELQATDMELGVRVPAGAFIETINRVARSASRDETRPHLTGVLVAASEKELRMVATDSYRLSVKETQLD